MFNKKYVMFTWVLTIVSISTSKLSSTNIVINSGEGFVVFLIPDDFSFGDIQKCSVRFNEETYEIDLKTQNEIITQRYEIIKAFSATRCGIRVRNATELSSGNWILTAQNEKSVKTNDSVRVNILKKIEASLSKTIELPLGRRTITCSTEHLKNCRIQEETGSGEPSSEDKCYLETTIRSKSSSYVCRGVTTGLLTEVEEHIEVTMKPNPKVLRSMMKTETHVVLSCELPTDTDFCIAEFPKQSKRLRLDNGLLSGRYSARDTNTAAGKCVLEIEYPLKNDENGIWTIRSGDSSTPAGCIFYVTNDSNQLDQPHTIKTQLINQALAKIQTTDTVEIISTNGNDSLEITCKAPYDIDKCYIKSPGDDPIIYFPQSNEFVLTGTVGECRFTGLPEISGLWTCGVSGTDRREDFLKQFKVIVYNSQEKIQGEILTQNTGTRRGDSAELLCRSGWSVPIVNCVFVDPIGNLIFMYDEQTAALKNVENRFEYFGEGFDKGHCGLRIKNVHGKDFGTWKCHFTTTSSIGQESVQLLVTLADNGVSQATSFGLGFGLGILALILIAIGTITITKRRRRTARHLHQSQQSQTDYEFD